jgi:hypothetical protein
MPRKPKVDADTIKTLEQRLAKVQQDLRRARTAEKKEARDQDTRRCVIAGRLALKHFEKNAGTDWGKLYFRLLDEYVVPRDRFLFEFLPVRDPPAVQDNAAPDKSDQVEPVSDKTDKVEAA